MQRDFINILRLLRVSFVLARCDALFLLDAIKVAPVIRIMLKLFSLGSNSKLRPGQKIAKAFYKLGPSFVKIGQVISTRSDIFGEEITKDLAMLQDKMPAFDVEVAKKIVESELSVPISDLYAEFSEPVAAASIAQVHKAIDKNGRQVAVKILRPNIEQAFAKNLDFMLWLAEISAAKLPARFKPIEVVKTIAEAVDKEMDLRLEAASASKMKENFVDFLGVKIPDIDWKKTSKRVLTLEWIDGTRIDDYETITNSQYDLDVILRISAEAIFKQVLIDGFFHADMHPGNIFITEKGELAIVDFGIMGQLDKKMQIFLADVLHGFLTGDYEKAARAHFAAGIVPKGKSVEEFALACRMIGEPIIGLPQNEISVAKLLAQLFKVADEFEMAVQPELLLLQKTMMTSEGVGRKLNPAVNMWQLAKPLITRWANQNMGAKLYLKNMVDEVREFSINLKGLVSNLGQISQDLQGGLRLHPESVKLLKQKNGLKFRHILAISIISSLATITTLVGAALVLINYGAD